LADISQTRLSPNRRSPPGWWCFNGRFSSHCPTKIPSRYFLKFTQHLSFPEACLPSPCLFQICLARSDITSWARSCLCQQGEIYRHVRLQPLPIPKKT
jgi:hypothetical protein